MADLPLVTGRKRCISEADDSVMTPKKARAQMLATPSKSGRTKRTLPTHLSSVVNTHIRLEEALIPALATTNAPAPVVDKEDASRFNMPNVLPHVSIPSLSLDNFKSLIWILEWNGEDTGKVDKHATVVAIDDSDNPFLVPSSSSTKTWLRGGLGIIITPTTHLNRTTNRRSAVYGIGIQVDAPKDGLNASTINIATRWIEGAEARKNIVQERVHQWAQMRKSSREGSSRKSRASSPTPIAIPAIPMASLPPLITPSSTLRSPVKIARPGDPKTPSKNKSTIAFPTPGSSSSSTSSYATAAESIPSTPSKSDTPFSTPMTARREALFERIRQRSLSNTPTKGSVMITLSQDQDGNSRTKVVGAEELKRRALLSKLDGVAECISLLFATNTGSSSVVSPQKRRIMRQDEVIRVIVKSSRAPLSDAEANESINLLLDLCPNFVIPRLIDRDTWLEMPSALSNLSSALLKSPTKRRHPPSPGAITQADLEEELLSRKPGEGSPKRVRVNPQYTPSGKQCMTLREVRERIREELEKE